MRRILPILFLISTMCGLVSAQSFLVELNKIRKIKLLESTRQDVKKILADYKSDEDEGTDKKAKKAELVYFETFSSKIADIEIEYVEGKCSDDDDEWNGPEGKVKSIKILLDKPVKFADFNFDFSDFRKEQKYANVEDLFVYHNKNLGIAFEVSDGEIQTVHLFPTNSYYSYLCENEEAEELREFYLTESFFGNSKLKDRVIIEHYPAYITELTLNFNEIIIGCINEEKSKNCSNNDGKISVTTVAFDPENDILTYRYTVSAGRIIGKGAKVVWDLSGVQPGTYTITAGVDDGCGVCSETVTKTVVVK